MEPNVHMRHEMIRDDSKYPSGGWSNSFRQKRLYYGLLALLHLLILALFIIIFSRSSILDRMASKKDISDFKSKVSDLSLEMEKLQSTFQGKTCENGWMPFMNSCYLLIRSYDTWQQSSDMCQKRNSNLVVIDSELEQIFLVGQIRSEFYSYTWIGLKDIENKGKWKWVDGTNYEASVKFWGEGEPKNDEDCVGLNRDGTWRVIRCEGTCYAVCEKKL